MSIPDPPWKKRTRPCPFYSQGRCVFAESCGFLHNVKIKSSADQESTSSSLDAGSSSRDSAYSIAIASIVKPPPTISVQSATSPSSPAHSPGMAGLLSALQGIIGPLSPEKAEFPTVGGDSASPDASDISPHSRDTVQCAGRVFHGTQDGVPVQTGREDVVTPTCTAVDSELTEDPPSADVTSPHGLLSPVQIGSVPPVPFPHVALGLGATLSRGDSIDSGYAEAWVGPTPFSLSPPQLNQRNSTLDLLSSPFGSPLSRVLPRRFSPSPTRRCTTPPRDSIDLVSPPVFSPDPPIPSSSRTSLNGVNLMYATQARRSPHHTHASERGEGEDANPSNGILDESSLPITLSVGSSAETLLFPRPPSEVPVLKYPPMPSDEDVVDPQLANPNIPCESSSGRRDKGSSSMVEGTVEPSPILMQDPSAKPSQVIDALPLPQPSMGTKITSLSPTAPLRSPIALKIPAEVAEFDYEALYQSLIMSPEEAASKRMSWASRLSPSTLPQRAASTDSPRADRSTSALVDMPERPHSAVDVRPWSHQRGLQVPPVLESGYTSHTSSPPLVTPTSSVSSRTDVSTSSVHVSVVPQPVLGLAAQSPSPSASKRSWHPAGNQLPHSAPNSAPLREVTSTLNSHSETDLTRSKWNHVSTSRKVPFGFRRSLVDRDHSHSVASRSRKRPSALTLSSSSFVEQYEAPGSARSFSSVSSQSTPSWARPLHLSRASETSLPIYRPNLHKESHTSANTSNSPLYFQHHSLASSSPLSPQFSQHRQVHDSLHSEYDASNSPTNDDLQLAALPPTETLLDSPHAPLPNVQSNSRYGLPTSHPEGESIIDGAREDEDQLRTSTQVSVPLPTTMLPLRSKPSPLSLASTSATVHEGSLMFAIASDDAESVHRVLEYDHADPNESMGPQSALAFALTNERLVHKLDIVKVLLAYGADPAALRNPELNPPHRDVSAGDDSMLLSPPPTTILELMNPAMRYYVSRADGSQTRHVSRLLQHTFFRPLGRVRYEIVGQDRVFEQLYNVLNQRSRRDPATPLVVLLCGPSGHGKSFLARRFGSLLGVPTHTVNMTTLRSTHDLWDSYSMSPYEELSTNTLSQFLIENEGERCVVVLDEIEKVTEPKVLYSLLMPWELGRCSPLADQPHIDVRQVIWLCTSNIGHELIFEFCGPLQGSNVTREKYLELNQLLRPHISQSLGASLSSRVTAVLPFIPFTAAELMAIATEIFCSLGGEHVSSISSDVVERVTRKAIEYYIPEEGARSLHRAVSSLLVDIDELL